MEFVYVVKREELFNPHEPVPQGFMPLGEFEMAHVSDKILRNGFFVERVHAEKDPSLKQVIPYVVLRRRDEVFLMKRLPKGGESRLHGKMSVGVGGHINPCDDEDGRTELLIGALSRELSEEVEIDWADITVLPVPLGLINDDSDEVGSIHVALALSLYVPDTKVRETDQLDGEWVSLPVLAATLEKFPEGFESWSKLVLEHLLEPCEVTA